MFGKRVIATCVVLALIVAAFPVFGAAEYPLKGLAVKKDGKPMLLGFIANEIRSGWMSAAVGYMGSLWQRAGGKFVSYVSEYNPALELSQVDDLIQLKPDAILFHPSDSAAIAPAVKKASDLGIPTFAIDVGVIGAPLKSFVHIDQEQLGKLDAEYMAKVFSKRNPGKIIHIMGGLEQDIAIKRRDGFNKEAAKYSYLKVLTEIDTKWSSEKALAAVMDALERFPDANAIYCHSDFMIQGVVEGLRVKNRLVPAGKKGHIVVCSIDGDSTGLSVLRQGYIDAIAEHSPALHDAIMIQIILACLYGHQVPPEIFIQPTLITKANMNSMDRWGNLPGGKFDEWPLLQQNFYKMPTLK